MMQKNKQQKEDMPEGMQRQNSAASSLNISSQCYIPNASSLYGVSTSANTS